MGTIATWQRIEPYARTTDIDVGLAAQIADPLWLLLRQWQLGELTGDDTGAAVAVDIAASWSRFSRISTGAVTRTLSPDSDPIEALVEREPCIRLGDHTPWTVRVRAGRSLARMLTGAGLGAVADRLARHPDTRFDSPTRATDEVGATREWQFGVDDDRYRTLLSGSVIDGARVLAAGRALSAEITGDADPDVLGAMLTRWREAMDTEWGITESAQRRSPAWIDDRQEYRFSIAAPPLPGEEHEVVLHAAEYDGTGIGWESVDLDRNPAHRLGAGGDTRSDPSLTDSRIRTVLATPLTFGGMPADRFWEFEDSATALGRVTNGATDLARALALDFAIVYSPDWYLAPVEIP
ncbi:hypothetical protein ACWEKT_40475, partial [Nocardia takedensis]